MSFAGAAQSALPFLVQENFLSAEALQVLLSHEPLLGATSDGMFYLPIDELSKPSRAAEVDAYHGVGVGRILVDYTTRMLPHVGRAGVAEFWFRFAEGPLVNLAPGPLPPHKAFLHRDESRWSKYETRKGPHRNTPSYTTVLYIAPSDGSALKGGDTYVCLERDERVLEYSHRLVSIDELATISAQWTRVPVRAGRCVGFPGDLLHVVAPSETSVRRVTFILNFWDAMPNIPSAAVRNPGGLCPLMSPKEFHLLARLGSTPIPAFWNMVGRLRGYESAADMEDMLRLVKDLALLRELDMWL